jgi:hypothetical protein
MERRVEAAVERGEVSREDADRRYRGNGSISRARARLDFMQRDLDAFEAKRRKEQR